MNNSAVPIASAKNNRKLQLFGGGVVALALILLAGWYFLIRDDSPPGVNDSGQIAAVEDAIAADAAEVPAESQPPADDTPAEAPAQPPADDTTAEIGFDGTWTVDNSLGSFTDFTSAFVGFRIDEELASVGGQTVVGRTPEVTGTLEFEGTTITSTQILVDMTGLTTDSGARDRHIKSQSIETNNFPEALFALTSPIELGTLPGDGVDVSFDATGDLTVHGVTRSVTIPLNAKVVGGVIVVTGELNLLLSDYDIAAPQAAIVLTVQDNADMEFQLFFTM
jgi:polyisoprenoid-binding protein YceI